MNKNVALALFATLLAQSQCSPETETDPILLSLRHSQGNRVKALRANFEHSSKAKTQGINQSVANDDPAATTESAEKLVAKENTGRFSDLPAPRALLCFVDTSEEAMGEFTNNLLSAALIQEAGPILTTQHLLSLILRARADTRLKPHDVTAPFWNALFNAGHFDPNNWIVKTTADGIFLLIPKKYLVSLKLKPDDVADENLCEKNMPGILKATQNPDVSDTEIALGLKVNHLPTVSSSEFEALADLDPKASEHYPTPEFIHQFWAYSVNASPLFLTKKDYATNAPDASIPSWSFFFGGHGTVGESISGIPPAFFKEIVSFMQTKINTRLLAYATCYGGGVNLETMFRSATTGLMEENSFAIICASMTDEVAFAAERVLASGDELPRDGSKLSFNHDFRKFVEAATTQGPINYSEAFSVLHDKSFNRNEPLIKLPGLAWFSPLDKPEKVFSISKILAASRDKASPLAIPPGTKTLTIYANYVPFELVFGMGKGPHFVSMLPGKAIHIFDRIQTNNSAMTFIRDCFLTHYSLKSPKIFFVKTLETKKRGKTEIFNNVVIANNWEIPGLPKLNTWLAFLSKADGDNETLFDIRQAAQGAPLLVKEDDLVTLGLYGKLLRYVKHDESIGLLDLKTMPAIEKDEDTLEILKKQFQALSATGKEKLLFFPSIEGSAPGGRLSIGETFITNSQQIPPGTNGRPVIALTQIPGVDGTFFYALGDDDLREATADQIRWYQRALARVKILDHTQLASSPKKKFIKQLNELLETKKAGLSKAHGDIGPGTHEADNPDNGNEAPLG